MTKARDFKFCTLVHQVTVQHWDYKLSLKLAWSWSCDTFKYWERSDDVSKTVQDRHIYNGIQMGNHIWPIESHDCQWP